MTQGVLLWAFVVVLLFCCSQDTPFPVFPCSREIQKTKRQTNTTFARMWHDIQIHQKRDAFRKIHFLKNPWSTKSDRSLRGFVEHQPPQKAPLKEGRSYHAMCRLCTELRQLRTAVLRPRCHAAGKSLRAPYAVYDFSTKRTCVCMQATKKSYQKQNTPFHICTTNSFHYNDSKGVTLDPSSTVCVTGGCITMTEIRFLCGSERANVRNKAGYMRHVG